VNWDTQFTITGISFADPGSHDTPLDEPTHATLGYSETETQSDTNCEPNTETYNGTFNGEVNPNGAHDGATIFAGSDSNNLYLELQTGLITGTSNQTGVDTEPPSDDSATWGSYVDGVTVPIHGNTASATITNLVVKDTGNGMLNTAFYGFSPASLNIQAIDTVTVSLHRGAPPTPKPPTTTITKGPAKKTTSKTATFRFTSSSKPAVFRCAIDGKAAKICTSPATYKKLKVGKHKFVVDATDKTTGLKDKTPAAKTWTVKKKPKKKHH
jgi:hypothetical protein